MLNGKCPVIVFQKTDFNKASIATSVYLDEEETGLALMSQNERVELASDTIIASEGKGLVSKNSTLKIKQRGIANGVDIVLKASRNSEGLNALLPLIDIAFQKAATGEYFVSYFSSNVALFKSKLASFSTNESPYDTSVTINISLIKESMSKEGKKEKKYNIALPEIGDKTKPDLINKVPKQVNELINKGSDVLKETHGVIDNIVSSLNQVCDQAKEFIKKGRNSLEDTKGVIDDIVATTLGRIDESNLVGKAMGTINEVDKKLKEIKIDDELKKIQTPELLKDQVEKLTKALTGVQEQMINALGNANTLIGSINENLKSAKEQVNKKTKEFIDKGSDVLKEADGVIDKAKGFIDKVSNVI